MVVNKRIYYESILGLKMKCKNIYNWIIIKVLSKYVDCG